MELNELLFDENTKIVRLKTDNGNIMYIEAEPENLYSVISICEDIAVALNIPVVLGYRGYEFLISPDKRTSAVGIMEKQNINDKYYEDMLMNEEIEKILNNATIENIAGELRRIRELKKVTHLYPGLHPELTVTPSKRLYELYKLNQPDEYLDSMVEDAKILKKTQSLNCSMNSK